MKNEQYYSVALENFATVSFVSGIKNYFGTLSEIEKFINALKTDCGDEKFLQRTIEAFEKFKNGSTEATHYAAYNEVRLLAPAAVYDSLSYALPTMEWEHLNIYRSPYKMRCSSAEIEHIRLEADGNFYRTMTAKFTNPEHDTRLFDDEPERWRTFKDRNFWGYPHIIEFEEPYTFNTLAVPEKRFKTEEELKADINVFKADPKPDFRAFCDDIFADG